MQVNPRYVPQLRTVLTWPHSIGIVGGRPSSSLYFVGFQGDNVLFLDPHETQQVLLPSVHSASCGRDLNLASRVLGAGMEPQLKLVAVCCRWCLMRRWAMHRPTTAIGCASCRWHPSTRRWPSGSTAAPLVSWQRLSANTALLLSGYMFEQTADVQSCTHNSADVSCKRVQIAFAPCGHSRHIAYCVQNRCGRCAASSRSSK
jgi:Peptidase family C54